MGISTDEPVNFAAGTITNINFTTNNNVKGIDTQEEIGIVGGGLYDSAALPGNQGSKIYGLPKGSISGGGQRGSLDRTLLDNSPELNGVYSQLDINSDGYVDATDRTLLGLLPKATENL